MNRRAGSLVSLKLALKMIQNNK